MNPNDESETPATGVSASREPESTTNPTAGGHASYGPLPVYWDDDNSGTMTGDPQAVARALLDLAERNRTDPGVQHMREYLENVDHFRSDLNRLLDDLVQDPGVQALARQLEQLSARARALKDKMQEVSGVEYEACVFCGLLILPGEELLPGPDWAPPHDGPDGPMHRDCYELAVAQYGSIQQVWRMLRSGQ